jgi:hypothetical protein
VSLLLLARVFLTPFASAAARCRPAVCLKSRIALACHCNPGRERLAEMRNDCLQGGNCPGGAPITVPRFAWPGIGIQAVA